MITVHNKYRYYSFMPFDGEPVRMIVPNTILWARQLNREGRSVSCRQSVFEFGRVYCLREANSTRSTLLHCQAAAKLLLQPHQVSDTIARLRRSKQGEAAKGRRPLRPICVAKCRARCRAQGESNCVARVACLPRNAAAHLLCVVASRFSALMFVCCIRLEPPWRRYLKH